MQERLYGLLKEKDFVRIEFGGKGPVLPGVKARVGSMPLLEGIKKTGLVYLVALIYLITAVLVFQRHRSTSGSLLAFFLLSAAFYFISAAPVATRSLTFPPSV